MATHILTVGNDGQTTDVHYFCSSDCQGKKVWSVAGVRDSSRFGAGERKLGDDPKLPEWEFMWGEYPGGSETDYDIWCYGCGDFMWHGMNCECEDTETDREPLTARQMRTRG